MDLRRFDLAILPALDALLRERNVTRAAAKLFVSQQALSTTLRRLRDYFDDQLLVRAGRTFELTPLGHSLVIPVREALLAAQAVLDTRPSFDPTSASATFRIAMSDYASVVLLPYLLRRLERDAPHIVLAITPVKGSSLRQLATGDLDLCLASDDLRLFAMDRPDDSLCSEVLFEDDFVVVFDGAAVNLPGLLDRSAYRELRHGNAVFEDGVSTIVERGWAEDGSRFKVAIVAPSFTSLFLMLPGTSIAATVQRRLARRLAPALGLTIAECPLRLAHLRETLMWHERLDAQPAHVFLRGVLAASARDLDEDR